MMHFAVPPVRLQPYVPFTLDTRDGAAYVTLVAFTMRGMRLRMGGGLTRWMTAPIASHPYLNVRTYVRVGDETGIHFLSEWLPNRVSVRLGPLAYGLPYRLGSTDYRHDEARGLLHGTVMPADRRAALHYHGVFDPARGFQPAQPGSLTEFLMERYLAFHGRRERARRFQVWHPPWRQAPVQARVQDNGLLALSGGWFRDARFAGAHYAPGFPDVGMGAPAWVAGACRACAWPHSWQATQPESPLV
jgi:uncharacterized protein YqjF (DUF2071 family)